MSWGRALVTAGLALSWLAAFAPASGAEDRETVLAASDPFPGLHRGDRIRLRLRGDASFRAWFTASSPETLFVASDRERRHERGIALSDIRGVDRRVGRHGHGLTGALLGLLAGAGIGALVSTSEEEGRDQWVATTLYTLAGAGGGLVVGGAAGLCIRSDRWAPVPER